LGEQHPVVSVCIANYNGADVIEQCLRSVCDQQVAASIEIIVHDDASSDNSAAMIQSGFPQAKLLVSDNNVGFCRANNKMVAQASGKYVLLLNNDAWLADDAIATFLDGVERHGDCIFTLPQYGASDEKLFDCGMHMDFFANAVPVAKTVEQPVAMVMGACLWISRIRWDSCEGLPEWFGSMAEDMYLCNRVRLQGGEVIALSQSAYFHHIGHSFGGGKVVEAKLSTTVKRRRLSERNKLYVMFLFYPPLVLSFILPLAVFTLILEGLLLAMIKRDFGFFTQIYGFALGGLWANIAKLRRERAVIQNGRTVAARKFFSVYRWLPYKLQMLLKHGIPEVR
jgi:GT2 family glycosyltransferase